VIGDRRVLAVISARGGSKGVPGKNLRPIGGRPLIAWTIEAAQRSRYVDRLIVSSDDAEILATARRWGCEAPFVRPAELAQDDTPGVLPVLHALSELPGYGYVVALQPTSPLRSPEDLDACLERCHGQEANACVTVTVAEKSPYWMMVPESGHRVKPLLGWDTSRRQDLPTVYVLNGAVYVARTEWLTESRTFLTDETLVYPMPRERSLDIDTELDLLLAEAVVSHRVPGGITPPAG